MPALFTVEDYAWNFPVNSELLNYMFYSELLDVECRHYQSLFSFLVLKKPCWHCIQLVWNQKHVGLVLC